MPAAADRRTPSGLSGLKRYAGAWSLWGLCVGAVITGEFSGWSRGLIDGGFGGLFVATTVITLMYVCLAYSLAEMAAVMPFTGAAYGYARATMGPWGGFLAGLAQIIEYTLSVAATVVSVGAVLSDAALGFLAIDLPAPVWWFTAYAVFIFLNSYDIALFFRTAMVLAVASLAVLAWFWALALPQFDLQLALKIPAQEFGTPWLPNGLIGIAWAIPFAVWFYLAIEQVPLASEEAREPAVTIPKAMLLGMVTLIAAAFLTLFLNTGVPPGARVVGLSDEPLLLGFEGLLGSAIDRRWINLLVAIGAFSSFHSIMYASGRSVFALGRAGYLPASLGSSHATAGTPHRALIAGGVLGFLILSVATLAPGDIPIAAILIDMAVFGALISYSFQFLSFVILRQRHPGLARPFRSPLGATGAITGLVIAVAAFLLLFAHAEYRVSLFACGALYTVGALYFHLYARSRLKSSPEEGFANDLQRSPGIVAKGEAKAPDGSPP